MATSPVKATRYRVRAAACVRSPRQGSVLAARRKSPWPVLAVAVVVAVLAAVSLLASGAGLAAPVGLPLAVLGVLVCGIAARTQRGAARRSVRPTR